MDSIHRRIHRSSCRRDRSNPVDPSCLFGAHTGLECNKVEPATRREMFLETATHAVGSSGGSGKAVQAVDDVQNPFMPRRAFSKFRNP
jgi:hypothetical protein